MAFKTLIDKDITKIKTDAIVNSLGVNGRIFGELCGNIVKAAGSEALKTHLRNLENQEYGSLFSTNGFNLPCKYIIHVVTPIKSKDEDCSMLKKAYRDVINHAIGRGLNSIALTFLGTGANGYSRSESYNACMEVCNEFIQREEKENRNLIDITLIIYMKAHANETLRNLERRRMTSRMIVYDKCVMSNSISKEETIEKLKDYFKLQEFYEGVDVYNFFVPNKPYVYPFDFIDDYMYTNDIDDDEIGFERTSLTPKRKYQIRRYHKLSKLQTFILIWALRLDKDKAVQFMSLNGLGFNPNDNLDKFMMDYLDGVYGEIENHLDMSEAVSAVSGVDFQF